VAVQVRVTLYVPAQVPWVVTSDADIVTVPSHASVAVGAIHTGTAGQLIGDVCVAQVIVGGVLSRTTIVPVHVAVLPQSSVAVHVRVTLYVPAHVPCVVASDAVIVTVPSHASVAVGAVHTGTAGQSIGEVCATHVITGAVTSRTTIVRLQLVLLPQSSVATQVRVTLYVPAHVPCVVASVMVIVTLASHRSVAVAFTHSGAAGQSIGDV